MVEITSPCTPMFAALSQAVGSLLDGQEACAPDLGNATANKLCKQAAEAITEIAKAQVDEKLLCSLYCCCKVSGGKQACVEEALDVADEWSGYKSRYKAEIAYNMQKSPPLPLMVKDKGQLTTQPLSRVEDRFHIWKRVDLEHDEDLRRPSGKGGYRYRRPDVVVVKDRTKPPTQDNISRVIEMKFPPERVDRPQLQDYATIAGGQSKVALFQEGSPCICNPPPPRPSPVPQAQDELTWWEIAELVASGLLLGAAVLMPADGPVGDAAAATNVGRVWTRTIGRPKPSTRVPVMR